MVTEQTYQLRRQVFRCAFLKFPNANFMASASEALYHGYKTSLHLRGESRLDIVVIVKFKPKNSG